MKIVPDTSAIIDGRLTEEIEEGLEAEIIIPEFVVDEVENQANKGLEIGFTGIEEIRRLTEKASEADNISVEFTGRKPSMEEINLASSGRIDALIRDHAEEIGATLYTADIVQSKIAEAKGIEVVLIEKEDVSEELDIEKYFDDETMSIHLKQDACPKAKRGIPGEFKLEKISEDLMTKEEIEDLIHNVMDVAENSEKGLIEMEGNGATVVQFGRYRIAMTRPPFSSAAEITAVRPVAKVGLEDYDLSMELIERLDEKAEGILVAGAPGHGKSTFAQALAEHYEDQDQVVKTMEKPRDLDVSADITQYTALDESMENTGDFLLLVRPDFTVFDEVRTSDFEVFSDMRMAGVGMIGIVHASEAVDAVQRLIGRVELGMIPQVCDTVIFIEDAEVAEVYELEMVVKVPEGMTEEDLARPVIQIRDFEDSKPVYEVYTYGEETVVIPVGEREESGAEELAKEQIEHFLQGRVSNPVIEFISSNHIKLFVEEEEISQVIGKGGENIDKLEKDLGLNITVEPKSNTLKSQIDYDLRESGNSVIIEVNEGLSGNEVDVYDGDEFLFTATVGKSGEVSMTKSSDLAGRILSSYQRNKLKVRS